MSYKKSSSKRAAPDGAADNGTAPPVVLDRALEFLRLMWAVDHQLHSVSKRMLGTVGITAPQRLALRIIGGNPGLTSGQLAILLHLDPGTVSGIVKRLEEGGLLTRSRNADDTRRMHLKVTRRGSVLNQRRTGTIEAAMVRTFDALKATEVAATSKFLQRFATELERL